MSAPTLYDRYRAACAALGLPVWRTGMATVPVADEPDFADPATLGCLLSVARKSWRSPKLFVRPTATGWTVMLRSGAGMGKVSDGPTEAEALVAALEAAARRKGGQP